MVPSQNDQILRAAVTSLLWYDVLPSYIQVSWAATVGLRWLSRQKMLTMTRDQTSHDQVSRELLRIIITN